MWGSRVVIPTKLQAIVLDSLHESHPGISRMKSIARNYVWWNGMDKAIENVAQVCLPCQAVKASPPAAPLHPWLWPNSPWTRIHMDFAGPFQGRMFFIVVDAHSKWPEVVEMTTTTTADTLKALRKMFAQYGLPEQNVSDDFAGPFQGRMFFIVVDAHSKWPEVVEMTTTTTADTLKALRKMFAQYGLPEQMVSDNGPRFVSAEFATFAKKNGIKHIRCAPYHPSSNRLAERFVQTFKRAMKASEKDGRSPSHRLAEFLMTYRATPHATTGVAPTTLFLQRQIRTRFDLLRPDVKRNVQQKQAAQKLHHDQQAKPRQLQVGQPVMARDFRHGNWQPGVITSIGGPLSYKVTLDDGRTWNRHIDHIRAREYEIIAPPSTLVPRETSSGEPNDFFRRAWTPRGPLSR